MKTKLILFLLLLALVGGASADELPEATQALLLEKKIGRAMESGDDAKTKALFAERDQLKIKMPPVLMMERAEFHYRLGDYLAAHQHLTEYLAAADSASPLYDSALDLLITLEEEAEAKHEAEANAKFAEKLGRQPSPTAKSAHDWTDLHYAAGYNFHETAALLLEKGAAVNAKNKYGFTPLHFAARKNAHETATLLIEKGAVVNAKNKYGNTPLYGAAWANAHEIAALLLEKGAAVNAKDNDGETPLHNAALKNAHEIAAMLLEKGADVNAKNKDGDTPLAMALRKDANETAALLREHGGKRW